MGAPSRSVPNSSEGEMAWIVTDVPSTTAAPATSDGAPAAVNRAAPRTASNAPPPAATAPHPVAIGFGSVRVTVSWAVPPAGALRLNTLKESGVAVEDRKSTRLNSSHLGISY